MNDRIKTKVMKVTNSWLGELHGKIGNVIFYTRNGKTYARRATTPGKKRKKERTPQQRAVTGRFRIVQRLYSYYCKQVSPDIWRLAAKAQGRMAPNLFHLENCGCFSGEGKLVKPDLFKFSAGTLLLPPELAVERVDGCRFRATWQVEEEEWPTCAGSDRLMAGVLYDDWLPSTFLAPEAAGTRGEGAGEFRLETKRGRSAHVYLFFAREDGSAYSPSAHFKVEIDTEN